MTNEERIQANSTELQECLNLVKSIVKPSGTLAIDGNGIYDVTVFENVDVNVSSGGGECDKPHIIEVEELPTENADATGLYKCKGVYYKAGEYGFHDIIVSSDDSLLNGSIKELYNSLAGIQCFFYIIPDFTTEGIEPTNSDSFDAIHIYYVESANEAYIYETDNGWFPMSSNDFFGVPFKGIISNVNEATERNCYYALISYQWTSFNSAIEVVNEFPMIGTEGSVYGLQEFNDIAYCVNGKVSKVAAIYQLLGVEVPCYTTTMDEWEHPGSSVLFAFYYMTDVQDIYMVRPLNGGSLEPVTNLEELTGLTFKGIAYNTQDITEDGYYVYMAPSLYKYSLGSYLPLVTQGTFEYTSNNDGTCYVSTLGANHPLDLVVPSVSPTGDTVTAIDALYPSYGEYYHINSLSIPDTVTELKNGAFRFCLTKNITIPNSVTTIGGYAFSDNPMLESITIPDSVTGSLQYICQQCSSLKTVVVSNNVTEVGVQAFINCCALNSVTLGNSIAKLNSYAFSSCDRLSKINLPASLTEIHNTAFLGCYRLAEITFEGTMEQWGVINKYAGWDKDLATNIVKCSDGDAPTTTS